MDTKLCSDCRQVKPISEFGHESRSKDGYRPICRECATARSRAWRNGLPATKRKASPVVDGKKLCKWCGELKPISEFSDGFQKGRVCNSCKASDWKNKHAGSYDYEQGVKLCPKCGVWHPFAMFSRSSSSPGGLKTYCKLCAREEDAKRKRKEKVSVTEKQCSNCGQVKPVNEFSAFQYSKDGLSSQCKSCINAYQKSLYDRSNKVEITEKVCSRCKQSKPIESFAKNKRSADGRTWICRECHKNIYTRVKRSPKHVPAEKVCPGCGEIKPASEFNRTSGRNDGLTTHCKACNLAYLRSPSGKLAKAKVGHRRKSQQMAAPATLTLEQWNALLEVCGNHCPKCGVEFTEDNPPTRDHIIPVKLGGGLTLENTQPLCRSCNSTKNWTDQTDYREQSKLKVIYSRLDSA